MSTFLLFNFLPSLNEFLIKRHVRYSSRQAFTNGFKTIESASNHIPGEKYSSFSDAKHPFQRSFNESLSRLIYHFPSPLSDQSHEHVRISKDCKRTQNLVDSLDELLDVKLRNFVLELGQCDLSFEEA